ncbi:MAG TPA: GNAT family N-acetyltransferase [Candidatus Limnocylindria bacterium]
MSATVRVETDASLSADEVNAAYAWVEWPEREPWRLEAMSRTCTWIAARDHDGELMGIARLLDDGGLHVSLWDVIVRPEHQRNGIGTALVRAALEQCADRRLVALVSTPAAVPFFAAMGFSTESHGHQAMYLRPHLDAHEH